MKQQNQENYLIHVLNSGFERAAVSFSKLINRQVRIVNTQSLVLRHNDHFSYISEEQGDLHILVTQVIGDITGKSYLVFNRDECSEIFKALNSNPSVALQDAFLLEIDNIISASVIAELSNALELEVYGDVPQLIKIQGQDLREFMRKEISKDGPSSVIFSNALFQFDNRERVHPQFIWKMSSRIFEMIPVDKITELSV